MYNLFRIGRKRKAKKRINTKYIIQKEVTRKIVKLKLDKYNMYYNFKYNRVAIRDQKSRWGSCSSKANLNFNYRVGLLSEELMDYVVVHELCHLSEMNHGPKFWRLVGEAIPNYAHLKSELKNIHLKDLG